MVITQEEIDDPVEATCPECGTSGEVPAAWGGLVIECKDCDERFTVPMEDDDAV